MTSSNLLKDSFEFCSLPSYVHHFREVVESYRTRKPVQNQTDDSLTSFASRHSALTTDDESGDNDKKHDGGEKKEPTEAADGAQPSALDSLKLLTERAALPPRPLPPPGSRNNEGRPGSLPPPESRDEAAAGAAAAEEQLEAAPAASQLPPVSFRSEPPKLPESEDLPLATQSLGIFSEPAKAVVEEKSLCRVGISDKVTSKAVRSAFIAMIEGGTITISLAELVNAVLQSDEAELLEDAVAVIRGICQEGGLQLFSCAAALTDELQDSDAAWLLAPPEEALRANDGDDSPPLSEEERRAAMSTVRAAPVCSRLVWPLLRAVLVCFKREQVRPTFQLVLETCRDAFHLEFDLLDLITVLSSAPKGSCRIDIIPWPTLLQPHSVEAQVLTAGMVTLLMKDEEEDKGSIIFPPHFKALETAVEDEVIGEAKDKDAEGPACRLEQWMQQALTIWIPEYGHLTVPGLIALADMKRQVSDDTKLGCAPSGGALLWFMEKHLQESTEAKCMQGAGGDKGAEDSEEEDADEEMTPLEAFITCFYDDLRSGRPLFRSQINNLYRMRSGGHEIKYRAHGYARMGEFLAEIPGIELVGTGNHMAVKVSDQEKLTDLAEKINEGIQQKAAEARKRGTNTAGLEVSFRRTQAVPRKILERIWQIFQTTTDHEIPVNSFIILYKARFPRDKLGFKALGFQDVRGLMAHVPFVEKVGGRRYAKYVLKEGAVPPKVEPAPAGRPAPSRNMMANSRWPQQAAGYPGADAQLQQQLQQLKQLQQLQQLQQVQAQGRLSPTGSREMPSTGLLQQGRMSATGSWNLPNVGLPYQGRMSATGSRDLPNMGLPYQGRMSPTGSRDLPNMGLLHQGGVSPTKSRDLPNMGLLQQGCPSPPKPSLLQQQGLWPASREPRDLGNELLQLQQVPSRPPNGSLGDLPQSVHWL